MELNRRKFLKLLSGATAGVGLSKWLLSSLQSSPNYSLAELLSGPGIESWVNSLCDLCECGCGISVRLIDGVPVNIKGNKLHPLNRGGVCMRGQAGLEILYNPDRFKNPMRRMGARGSGRWQNITWEEAIEAVAGNLKNLRESNRSSNLVFLVNNINEPLDRLLRRFTNTFGTPYYFKTGLTFPNQIHYYFMHGSKQDYVYDLERTNYILSFGSHFLESEPGLGWYSRIFGYIRRERTGSRAKIVQIDPQFSITGMKADEWIFIRPGTYGVLALGIAHILIKEDQYDKEFIASNTFGFDDWQDQQGKDHIGFKTLILRDYTPEIVAKITGVTTETIVRLAREFAYYKPALALIGNRCSWHSNGVQTAVAIHALNALVGNVGTAGGVVSRKKVPFTTLPSIDAENLNEFEENQFTYAMNHNGNWISADLLSRLLTQNIQSLFIYQANPLYYTTNVRELEKALLEIPFIVSFSSFPDETTQFADIILPDHVFLEKWQATTSPPDVASLHLGISAPVLKPLYETKNFGDIILKLANNMGGNVTKNLPWTDYEAYLKAITEGVYESGRGTIFSESYDESWIRFLEERGWHYPAYLSFEEFWKDLKEKGGWWEPKFQEGPIIYDTPSGKFEFYSQTLRSEFKKLQKYVPKSKLKKTDFYETGDDWFLPRFNEYSSFDNDNEFKLYLNPYLLTTLGTGNGARQPTMLEILGIHIKKKWSSWIEINPADAEQIGLYESDLVWIVTSKGKIKAQVHVYPAAAPGIVSIPIGLGHNGYGRFADEKGANIIPILRTYSDPVTGQNSLLETRVKLIKI
ncbi:MAG: molybdopterin-dependent oxidoreductase [bacterium]|nr:MAG: molybdopterin-dependent oxidoreductase [bacterium]